MIPGPAAVIIVLYYEPNHQGLGRQIGRIDQNRVALCRKGSILVHDVDSPCEVLEILELKEELVCMSQDHNTIRF